MDKGVSPRGVMPRTHVSSAKFLPGGAGLMDSEGGKCACHQQDLRGDSCVSRIWGQATDSRRGENALCYVEYVQVPLQEERAAMGRVC